MWFILDEPGLFLLHFKLITYIFNYLAMFYSKHTGIE